MSYTEAVLIKKSDSLPPLKSNLKKKLFPFQEKGVYYLYAAKKSILADSTGLGKTAQVLGLFDFLEQRKQNNRWIIVVPANALYQWDSEFKKFTDFIPTISDGDRSKRASNYIMKDWQFLIVSYQTLWHDWRMLTNSEVKNWVFDDAHFFKHHNTKTGKIVRYLTQDSERLILTTATPIQKTLMDMHSLLEVLNLNSIFGSEISFRLKYCLIQIKILQLKYRKPIRKEEIVGYKNIDDFKIKVFPYYLKRTFEIVGQELPDLMVRPIWLGLHEEQKKIYGQLKNRFIKAYDEGKFKEFRNKGFHSILQTLAGTRTVGLDSDISMKLDCIEFFIKEKLGKSDKIIIYSFYKETVIVLLERLKKLGLVNIAVITGDIDSKEKENQKIKFIEDPKCQILIGTGAIENALNLQVARYMIMADLILNNQRIVQLVGRMRRLGSTHKKVILYILLTKGTVEESLWDMLKYEAVISDVIFGEKSEIFPSLTDEQLMAMLKN